LAKTRFQSGKTAHIIGGPCCNEKCRRLLFDSMECGHSYIHCKVGFLLPRVGTNCPVLRGHGTVPCNSPDQLHYRSSYQLCSETMCSGCGHPFLRHPPIPSKVHDKLFFQQSESIRVYIGPATEYFVVDESWLEAKKRIQLLSRVQILRTWYDTRIMPVRLVACVDGTWFDPDGLKSK
jgi:hypothetical protein